MVWNEAVMNVMRDRQQVAEIPKGTEIFLWLVGDKRGPEGRFLGCGESGLTISQGMGQRVYNWFEIDSVATIKEEWNE